MDETERKLSNVQVLAVLTTLFMGAIAGFLSAFIVNTKQRFEAAESRLQAIEERAKNEPAE